MKNQTTGRTSLLTQFLILAIAMGLPVLAPKAPAQQVGYALNFQPLSNNYVNIHLTAPPATNYSLTTWVFLRTGGTFTGTRMAVLGGPACNTSIELLIRSQTQFTTDAQYLELGRCSAFNGTPSTTAVPLNAWTHVAVTVNSNKVVSYYLNGLPAGSWTNADYDFSLNSTVFLADNSGGRAFDGQLNNVQIWQRVLTPAEVLSNLNHSLTGSETGLLGWYPFLEGSGTTTTNAATNVLASAGTLVNHPLWGPATMPAINSLFPATGPTVGGITNTLQGINFGTSGTVTIGGVQASVIAWSQTTIQCRLPAGQGMNQPVIVTVAGQSSAPVLFNYDSPFVFNLYPSTGPTVGGITNTLQGINFGNSGTVTVGGVQAAIVDWSQTTIRCRLPAGQGMNQPVIVNVGGQSSTSVPFHYNPPVISSVSPATDPTAGDTIITVAGINFGTTAVSNTVTVNGVQAAIVAWSQTNIQCLLPAGQGTNLTVIVTVVGQNSAPVLFSYNSLFVFSLSPSTGPTIGGITNTLQGINFGNSGTVTVGGVQAAIVDWSQTTIRCRLPAGQGMNQPVIVTAGGQSSAPVSFRYDSPAISSLNPATGPTAGGITNTLQGINFGTSGTVTIGEVPAAIIAWSQTSIQYLLPAGQGTNLPVIVTVAEQSSTPASFSYNSPAISSLSPTIGPTAGGITNTLRGINFGTSGTVTFDGVQAAIVAWSQTNIQCRLPAGQGTNLPVIITVAEQSSKPASFSYNSPVIVSLSPANGPTTGGITNALQGINFGTSGTVTIGEVPTAIIAWSQTSIQYLLPAGQGTNLPIIVTASGQSSPPASFSYNPPVIFSLSPATDPTAGDTIITVTGINFGTTAVNNTVTIDGVQSAIVAWSQTSIQCLLPAGQGTNLPMIVTVAGQSSPPALFSYSSPFVFSLSPATGPTIGGVTNTLQGINFGTSGTVTFDGVQAAIVAWSQTNIQCRLPAGEGTNLPVIVTAGGQSSAPVSFRYNSPVISSLSPATGPTIGGVTNTLQGINFGTSGTVIFDGVQAAIVAWSQTNIQCLLPAGQGTNLPVIVTVGGQSSAPVSFRYNSPVISSLSPATGPTAGGITNTLRGINFGTSGTVTIGGVPATVVDWSQTNIQCRLPAGQGTNLPVIVTVGEQTSPPVAFSYNSPVISSLNPATGPTAGGITNTLQGINFGTSGTVTIGGMQAAIIAWSQTSIQCLLPAGQGTNLPVIVTLAGQSSTPASFSYNSPVISSLSPTTGPTAGDTTITVTGINFGAIGASNTLTIGGVQAAFIVWSQTNIQCRLPAGQGVSLPVIVTVAGQSSAPVLFSYNSPVIFSLSPSSGPTAGGTLITLAGTNFGIAGMSNTVTIGGITAPAITWSHSLIRCLAPAGVDESASVTITAGGQTSNARFFNYTRPTLTINLSSNGIILAWPTNAPDYVLEKSGAVRGAPWTLLTPTLTTNTSDFITTMPMTNSNAYFRLRRP